ncbi:MAG: hypothetical protein GWN54_05030, partial [Gammaproteobacteria bacterium]|nr:hypothetical protein [Gammaproteobacteria bacterium]
MTHIIGSSPRELPSSYQTVQRVSGATIRGFLSYNRRMLTQDQVRKFRDDGFIALESVVPPGAIGAVRNAAARIVGEFDIDAHRTVFSTTDRDRSRDRYFMESAEAVHCFLEEGALNDAGELVKPRALAINKIG